MRKFNLNCEFGHLMTTPVSFHPQAFIELALSRGVLKFGEFTLKSGRVSPYFFNAGLLNDGEALSLLAQGYADKLTQCENVDVIFWTSLQRYSICSCDCCCFIANT